jgi:hypothetical protein
MKRPGNKISREELCRQLCEMLKVDLGAKYKISEGAIAKLGDRLEVPRPPKNYWARKAVGQQVIKYRLRRAGWGVPDNVLLSSVLPKLIPVGKAETADPMGAQPGLGIHPIIGGWINDRNRRIQDVREHSFKGHWQVTDRIGIYQQPQLARRG